MEVDLRARIDEMIEEGAAAKEPQSKAPDTPRYSFTTTYPYGTFKSSDMYLWLDRLYKISRIKTVRAGMPGAPPMARKPALPVPVAAAPKAVAKAPPAAIAPPKAPVEMPAAAAVAPPKTVASIAAAIRKKKAEKAAGPAAEETIQPPKAEEQEAEIEVAEEPVAPSPRAFEPEEMEIEAEAAAAAPAKKRKEEEMEIEEREPEIESKGDIGELNISEEDIKKADEEEARPAERKAERAPSGKIRISYIDEHEDPKIAEPEMLSWDIVKKAEEDISSINEGVKSSVYNDRIDITKRLLELTKMKITEKNLDSKKKIDSEIMLLRDRMKGEKVKTADLPSLVKSHLSSELESAITELGDSLDAASSELKSKYENAKRNAEGDNALLSSIEIQFVKDSNYIAEEFSKVIDETAKFLVEFHCRKADVALSKDIFDKKEAESLKGSIRRDYGDRFGAIRGKLEAIRQKKQELVTTSSVLSAVVTEISSMKEAELLHELGARDRKAFLLYIKGEMSKSAAIAHARRGIAKERGLPDELVDRYFPKGEET